MNDICSLSVLNFVLPACRPSFAKVVHTKYKVDRPVLRNAPPFCGPRNFMTLFTGVGRLTTLCPHTACLGCTLLLPSYYAKSSLRLSPTMLWSSHESSTGPCLEPTEPHPHLTSSCSDVFPYYYFSKPSVGCLSLSFRLSDTHLTFVYLPVVNL